MGNCTDSSPNLQAGFWDGGSFHPTPLGTVLTSGNWYQVVGTWDGSNMALYLNGAVTSSLSIPGFTSASGGQGIRLMRRWDADQYWGGKLSIVRIYSVDIGSVGVAQNFAANRSRFGL